MSFVYVTADQIGERTGGGLVTKHEHLALEEMGPTLALDRKSLDGSGPDPWKWDQRALELIPDQEFRLAHLYSGTFSQTVERLKRRGCKVAYTVAAHHIATSKEEHEKWGFDYSLPHMTNPDLLRKYVTGYLLADRIVVPSTHSKKAMLEVGADEKRIVVIPHGVEISDKPIAPLPTKFTVGYFGAWGPDKGIGYLLMAWKALGWKDSLLKIGGSHSALTYARDFVRNYGGGNVELVGWVEDENDFYDLVTLYVQPSATEGFGCPVLESMARGRITLCSNGAGAADVVPSEWHFPARDYWALAEILTKVKKSEWCEMHHGAGSERTRNKVRTYCWDRIRKRYQELWRGLLDEPALERRGTTIHTPGGRVR